MTGRSAGRTSLPVAGHSSSRTTSTPTSTTPPLSRLRYSELGRGEDAIGRGVEWLVGMQSRDGGWGAFDVDNDTMWLYKIPFCDFGKVTDEPCSDVTAHSLETLGTLGIHPDAAERGLDWLLSEQEKDGSWFGRWGVNHLYGTGRRAARPRGLRRSARPSLDAARGRVARLRPAGVRRLRRGHSLLRGSRLARPGRVHDARRRRPGRYSPTWPQETLKIRSCGRAADYLCAAQRTDGDWDEEHFTGTGFPLDFMIRYHLYRITFPLLALGRLRERLAG